MCGSSSNSNNDSMNNNHHTNCDSKKQQQPKNQSTNTKFLQVEFGGINETNIEQLRSINTSCFPVSYNQTFYTDVINRHNDELNKFAYYNGCIVGAVCCRIEPIIDVKNMYDTYNKNNGLLPDKEETNTNQSKQRKNIKNNNGQHNNQKQSKNNNKRQRLYIMTLGVLAAYRGRGIGTQLIQSLLDYCEAQNNSNTNDHDHDNTTFIDEISLHVQISNNDAIDFYKTKFNFSCGDMIENYYKRIQPPHCYILTKQLR